MKYLFALAMMVVSSTCFADSVLINGTGLFDTNLGTLTKATVRFRANNVSMGSAAAHTHTIAAGQQVGVTFPGGGSSLGFTLNPFNTSAAGLHTHTFTIPSFTWNGLTVDLGTNVSNAGGLHSHIVSGLQFNQVTDSTYEVASSVTTGANDTHSQTFSFDKGIAFTGSDLNTFLSGTPTANYTLNFVVPGETHTHQISAGTYMTTDGFSVTFSGPIAMSSTLSGSHTVNFGGSVVSTTFEYTPFSSIPEPSSFILFSVVAGAGAVGRRVWSKRKLAKK